MFTHVELEASTHNSEPFEFYEFTASPLQYLYSAADFDVLHAGKLYQRAAISRSDIEGTSDPDKGTISIEMPYTLPIMEQLIRISPSVPVELTIWRGQRGNYVGDGTWFGDDAKAIWIGRVNHCGIQGDSVTLQCISILNQQYRMGNTLRWQKACGYALYDLYNCRLNPEDFALHLTINEAEILSTARIQKAELGWGNFPLPPTTTLVDEAYLRKGWFVGGFIEYYDSFSGTLGKRSITGYDDVNGIITVFPPTRGMAPNQVIKVFPGCKHTSKECKEKFDNIENYGGDPSMPVKDPYDPFERIF